jgi:hypothetical protein
MRWLLLLLMLSLAGCQYMRSPEAKASPGIESTDIGSIAAPYRKLADEGVAVYRLDAADSDVRIHVFRGGRAARVGHNHLLQLPRLEGYVAVPTEAVSDAHFDLRFALEDLVLDDPALRAETGGAFADPLSESDIQATRRNMLGTRVLDADNHPEVRLRSQQIGGDWPFLLARVVVTLHGQESEHEVLLRVTRDAERMRVQGQLLLRQSEHGITPMSILGGLLTVQDAIAITFDLDCARTSMREP